MNEVYKAVISTLQPGEELIHIEELKNYIMVYTKWEGDYWATVRDPVNMCIIEQDVFEAEGISK